MKRCNKIISILLSIIMTVLSISIIQLNSFAAIGGTTGECNWTLDGTVLTISGNGKMGDYNYDINYSSPWGTKITKVVIENGVTSIGNQVFDNCTSLTSVTIGNGVTSIGGSAFEDCTSLTSITIPDSVTSIGDKAFYNCKSLTSITIPDSVTSIGEQAFKNCTSLTSVTIGNSVTSIGISAFNNCKSLTSVTIGNGVTEIGWGAFRDCTSLTSVTIPDGVTSIGGYAFNGCTSLTSVTIPDSVTSIGDWAFKNCTSLTSVTIGNSVTSIGTDAFRECTSLTSVTIPDSVTSIGECAFVGSAYYNNSSNWRNRLLYIGNHLINTKYNVTGNVEIRQGTKTIADKAFYCCGSLASVTIPDSVTSIGRWVFKDCYSLTSINIPESVTSMGNEAFCGCRSLASVTIPDSITSIGNYAFCDCTRLTSMTIPDSVIEIGDCAFYGCTWLTSVTIPGSVTSIGSSAFSVCTSLTSVTIPDSVTSIGSDAFRGCISLTSVTIPDSVTSIGEYAFGYYFDPEKPEKIENFIVYGNKGSAAERYANENGFEFLPAESAPLKFFPDVIRDDWYYNAVNFNVKKGYVTGYSNGTFGPSNNIQRQDFVLILARIAGANLSTYEGQNGGFSDVQAGAYYASAVAWAKDKGIVTGYSADNFGVGTYITREQISLILCRYLNGSASGNVDTILNAYSDGGNTSPWAKAGVAWAVENGIIGNSDYLNPNGNAGRAEVAQIIYNMSNKGML